MKIKLQIELEFESWFEPERIPKTKEEWAEFFTNNYLPETSIIGIETDEYQDIIQVNKCSIECINIEQ